MAGQAQLSAQFAPPPPVDNSPDLPELMDAVAEADCEAAAKAVFNIAELTANPDAPRRRERALEAAACARAAAVAARKIADASPTPQAQRQARIAENCANAAELQASVL